MEHGQTAQRPPPPQARSRAPIPDHPNWGNRGFRLGGASCVPTARNSASKRAIPQLLELRIFHHALGGAHKPGPVCAGALVMPCHPITAPHPRNQGPAQARGPDRLRPEPGPGPGRASARLPDRNEPRGRAPPRPSASRIRSQ